MPLKQTLQNIFFGYQYNSSINFSSREEIKKHISGNSASSKKDKSNVRSQIIGEVHRQEKQIYTIIDFF